MRKRGHILLEGVYEEIPLLLQMVCKPFDDLREKAMMLYAAIVIYSGIFSRAYSYYNGDKVFSNLYLIILGQAASGKSVVKYAAMLASAIDREISKAAAFSDDRQRKSSSGLFLTANAGASFWIREMLDNPEESKIVFDTEIDTLTTTLKQEWGGGNSEVLRKAFHHEPISIGRLTDDLRATIENPKISVVLTGTPDQMSGLFKSFEDGLLSRCMLYVNQPENRWRRVTNTRGKPRDIYFKERAESALLLYKAYQKKDVEIVIDDETLAYFNERLESFFNTHMKQSGESVAPLIKRGGLIAHRIAMVFTLLRNYRGSLNDKLVISKKDVELSTYLAGIAMNTMIILQKESLKSGGKFSSLKEQFIEALPSQEFRRSEAIAIGQQFTHGKRTIDLWLQDAVKSGLLIQQRPGLYKKS